MADHPDPDDAPTTTTTTEHLSQYDILVYEKDNELDFLPPSCSDPPPPHVGNNRLKVFLKMNMHNFVTATTPGEQQQVIDTILGLVQQSQCGSSSSTSTSTNDSATCPRSGRFWMQEQQQEGRWTACSTQTAREFVQGLLEEEQRMDSMQAAAAHDDDDNIDDEKKRRRRSSLLRRSMSSGNMIEDQKKRVAYRRSVLMQLETLDVSDDGESDEEDQILRVAAGTIPNGGDEDTDPTKKPAAQQPPTDPSHTTPTPEEAKSSSTVEGGPTNSNNSNTTTTLDDTENLSVSTELHSNLRSPVPLKRSTSLTSLMETGAVASHVLTAEALDVILNRRDDATCPYALVPNHTGNNRLLVMVHQRAERYETIVDDSLQVSRMCRELVETIQTFYNGRFLVEQAATTTSTTSTTTTGDLTPSTYFIKLTDDQAATALACVFRLEAQATTAAQQQHLPPPTTTLSNTKQSAMDAIAALSAGTALASDAHKTALKSLQRKKKRQDTQNKITQNYARFGTSSSDPAAAAVSSATTGIPDHHHHHNHMRGHLMDHRAHSVGLIGQQQPAAIVPEPLAVLPQRRASSGMIMPARRSTLSAFSAGMIEDMLHRLDVEQAAAAQELDRQQQQQQQRGGGGQHFQQQNFR